MSNFVKYGHYYISASILVAGAVWLNRPADPRVMGEDTADVFEQVQECLVVPYLSLEESPDWNAANAYGNDYPSNSIYSPARYVDIQTMANRIRSVVTKMNTFIFWTDHDFSSNTVELAVSHGAYSSNEVYASTIRVDELNAGGWLVTNRFYRYTTNTFSDAIGTTATRQWATNSLFEATIPIDGGGMIAVTKTNYPVANYVYGRGSATGLTNTPHFHTPGSWWPFAWSYAFPWEQWSGPTKSRVTVFPYVGSNVSFTNVAWVVTNALAVSMAPVASALPGFLIGSLMDVGSHVSAPFIYLQPPANNNNLYLSAYQYAAVPGEFNYIDVRVSKGASAYNAIVTASVVWGDTDVRISAAGQGFSFTDFSLGPKTNASFSVFKFEAADTNVPAIYATVSWSNAPAVMTNAYFTVTKQVYINEAVTGSATTNAVASTFTATDDRRITTNKLNQFAQVLTNLNRTVYIGGLTLLSCTNRVEYQAWHQSTNYVSEYLGDLGETPSYYDSYTKSALLADVQTPNYWVTNQFAGSGLQDLAIYSGEFLERGESAGDNTPEWEWWSLVTVDGETALYTTKHEACTPAYPSLYAITNNMVKSVKVYAVIEANPSITLNQDYYDWDGLADYYSHTVSGEYWHQGNLGASVSNITLSAASHTLDASRVKGWNRRFYSYGHLGFTDKAVFNLIYQTNNPTSQIRFDLGPFSVTPPDLATRHAYFDWETVGTGEFAEGWQYHYDLAFLLKITRVLIVVDWDFKHLGRGFTPANNTPAWRP